ncbi:MAG TPA: 4-hydroxy-tetrahydrodipicolinate reductase [Sedimentisphaerales bacterium]|nr:4-hydroxy-tetrahydrodipicolinate reductase [Sedimentisphaerales bacterium]
MKPRLLIVGAAGRMGKHVLSLAGEAGRFEIVGAIERQGHPDIGRDAGLVAGAAPLNVKLESIYPGGADAAIDFSTPEAADKTIDYCLENAVALVLGTTGLSDRQRRSIKAASEKIPLLYGTNMSVGMNVLFALVGKVASMLGEEYDIEIIERHHRFKKDAPSGSALTLAENICNATGRDFPACIVHGRSGKDAPRQKGAIGMHAVRAGDTTGVHSVIFGTLGETLTLHHTAHSRDTFAAGALRAAQWLLGKEPGLYSMADVLGI